jgi:hypothetical protein
MHFDAPVTNRIPLPPLDLRLPADRQRHDLLAALSKRMAACQQQLANATDRERIVLCREHTALTRRINTLVYALYGLDDLDIALVEKA